MPPTDREQLLQELANKNAWWAEAELSLLKTIREHKRKLIELPDIIRQLEAKREFFTAEMNRAGAEHDAAEAEFQAWADEQADDYADHRLAVQPPVGW